MSKAKTVFMSRNGGHEFDAVLRSARIAESAHFEAVLDIRDAKTLRLQVLKDDLAPALAAYGAANSLFDLALVPGETPRLWIDLITNVIMEPDPRTYRLIQDTRDGRVILSETSNKAEMAENIRTHMAHQLIVRERQLAATPAPSQLVRGYSSAALMLSWLSGFSIGVLSLFIIGILLGKARW